MRATEEEVREVSESEALYDSRKIRVVPKSTTHSLGIELDPIKLDLLSSLINSKL